MKIWDWLFDHVAVPALILVYVLTEVNWKAILTNIFHFFLTILYIVCGGKKGF